VSSVSGRVCRKQSIHRAGSITGRFRKQREMSNFKRREDASAESASAGEPQKKFSRKCIMRLAEAFKPTENRCRIVPPVSKNPRDT